MSDGASLPLSVDDHLAEAETIVAVEDEVSIALTDPDVSMAELEAVDAILRSPRISAGTVVRDFEDAFAAYVGRKYAIAVPSGTIGLLICLRAMGIGAGDEVITSSYGFRETGHAVSIAGAHPIFAGIDYWAGNIVAEKAEPFITSNTRAIIGANNNGHPAAWDALRDLADRHNLILIEDSTEAIGSSYKGKLVGNFGDCAVFDFSQPLALTCGEGGMIVTDDTKLAMTLRQLCTHSLTERVSVSITTKPAFQAGISDMSAALGLAQLERLDDILARRKQVENFYCKYVQSFEGIKPPYVAADVTEVHWFLYLVQLGTRFTRSSRDSIINDLGIAGIEAAAYSVPLHLQRHYFDLGYRRGDLFVTEKVADRAIALPFHGHLSEEQVAFIVETMKDSSINVGAGAAIY
ncbi:DegT/DnrJ/EryC1/StrS family aminotransferase [Thalassospira sp. MA62]|nr:DegT/DnrJ/EryC1/StrS family aminotransferase [Thalassospira sp. MA62]